MSTSLWTIRTPETFVTLMLSTTWSSATANASVSAHADALKQRMNGAAAPYGLDASVASAIAVKAPIDADTSAVLRIEARVHGAASLDEHARHAVAPLLATVDHTPDGDGSLSVAFALLPPTLADLIALAPGGRLGLQDWVRTIDLLVRFDSLLTSSSGLAGAPRVRCQSAGIAVAHGPIYGAC